MILRDNRPRSTLTNTEGVVTYVVQNELEDRDYLGAIGISSSNWGGSSSSSSHWNDDDWP